MTAPPHFGRATEAEGHTSAGENIRSIRLRNLSNTRSIVNPLCSCAKADDDVCQLICHCLGVHAAQDADLGPSARAGSAPRSSGWRSGSRSKGSGTPEPISRARWIDLAPKRRRISSAAWVARRRRSSATWKSDNCWPSSRCEAATPSSLTLTPLSRGRASSRAARKMTSVWSVGSGKVRWRVVVVKVESRILTATVCVMT